jgi:DNA-binding MurR/RpiR family transcriptional regulator
VSTESLTFSQRIAQQYGKLSPQGRKLADHLLHNNQDMLHCTVAQLAEMTETSKATVSRFFRQLGYDSHLDAKSEINALRTSGYPINLHDSDSGDYQAELSRIQQTFDNIDAHSLQTFINQLSAANRITLIGFRNSYPVAMHFRQQLQQIHGQVRLLPLPGQSIGEDLEDLLADEVFIVIGFRRRPKLFNALLQRLPKSQLTVFADPSGQLYQDNVAHLFICQLGHERALDSYAAPMSLIAVICNKLLAQLGHHAKQRIASISKSFSELGEIE